MADTAAHYIARAKQYLYTGAHELLDKLTDDVTVNDSQLTVQFGNTALQPTIRLSCGLEDMYVWRVSGTANKTATVERGQFGTDTVDHSAGSLVTFSPKFSDAEIFREINNEILDLPNNGIYQVASLTLASSPVLIGYTLPSFDANWKVLEVRAKQIGPEDLWTNIESWNVEQVGSIFSLQIREPVPVPSTLTVTYKRPFAPLTALSNVVTTTTGLPSNLLDIPLLGAAIRLTAGREIRRNFDEWQGDTRRAEEVPPGANNAAPRNIMMLYRTRVIAEANRLSDRFPARKPRRWTSW